MEQPLWKYEDYNDWSRLMAKTYTRAELETMLYGTSKELTKATQSHLNAIKKTTSMQSNSQRRAQSRNNVTVSYEKRYAIENALEIYQHYPENTKEGLPQAVDSTAHPSDSGGRISELEAYGSDCKDGSCNN